MAGSSEAGSAKRRDGGERRVEGLGAYIAVLAVVGGGCVAAQRCRRSSSSGPWERRSWTMGKILFWTSGRQRLISSKITAPAPQIAAGVRT